MIDRVLATGLFMLRRSQYRQGLGPKVKYLVDGRVMLRFAVPAFLYACSNNLGYYSLRYLDPPTFQVLTNMGIPIVAVVHRAMMRKRKSVTQVGTYASVPGRASADIATVL